MEIKLLNVILFAENYEDLVNWYQTALNLEVVHQETNPYHYTELGLNGKGLIGITPAKEIQHKLSKPKNNACVMQLSVKTIVDLFEKIKLHKGKVLFGPSKDEKYDFQYGGIADIEDNEIWVVQQQA